MLCGRESVSHLFSASSVMLLCHFYQISPLCYILFLSFFLPGLDKCCLLQHLIFSLVVYNSRLCLALGIIPFILLSNTVHSHCSHGTDFACQLCSNSHFCHFPAVENTPPDEPAIVINDYYNPTEDSFFTLAVCSANPRMGLNSGIKIYHLI